MSTGKFVTAAIKHRDTVLGSRIHEAADYYTPSRVAREFSEVTGHPAKFIQLTAEQYKSFLPPAVAEELYENHLLLEGPGYYAGASLDESLALLDEKPTTWKEFIVKSGFWN